MVPLPLLPVAAQAWLLALRFAVLADVPYRIYCGALRPRQAALPLAIGLGWTLALVGMGRALLARAQQRLVVQEAEGVSVLARYLQLLAAGFRSQAPVVAVETCVS